MATTTTTMRFITRKHMLLPDLWVTHDVRSKSSGQIVKTYYLNLRTRQRFYSKAALYSHFRSMAVHSSDCQCKARDFLKRERAEEEEDRVCSVCEEIGHSYNTCPYPVIHKINPFAGTRIRRCSRCHWLGHNVRTCRQAV